MTQDLLTDRDRPVMVLRAQAQLPAWPVVGLVGLFPLWWATGLLPFITIPFAILMVAFLMRAREIRLVPGVLPWLAFAAWAVAAAVTLDSPERLIGYSLRVSQFVAAGVALVYLVNARHTLPLRRVLGSILVVWASGVVGGLLGLLLPEFRLMTPVGLIIPDNLTQNEYVRDLVFPTLAEVQQPWGAESPFIRPTGPFTYANGWGGAMAILTPLALAGMTVWRSTVVRALIVVGIAASLVPAIASSNRGMYVALAVALGYAAIRFALWGRALALFSLLAATAAVGTVLFLFGAVESILSRLEVSHTTDGRAALYRETISRALDSPVLGYGGPRPSLASEISVGTQGQVWFALFSFGFVGLALYLIFLWGATLRTLPVRDTTGLWIHSSLVAASVMVFYYGMAEMQLILILIAGLMLRERYLPLHTDR